MEIPPGRWLGIRVYASEWYKPLGVGAVLIALLIYGGIALYRNSERELKGGVQRGYATVERVYLITPKGSSFDGFIRVLNFHINGREAIFSTKMAFSEGEVVGVSYRVGVSGRVYIDDVYSAEKVGE